MYKRAVVLKLYLTSKKQRQTIALIESYRKAVNFYLKSFEIEEGKLNKETLARLTNTKLSERYKSNALKQALSIYKGCKKSKKKVPIFKGFPILDAKFINIENGGNSFDLWIKLSTLNKGKRIYLPSKKHKMFNKWSEKGKLVQGCELHENKVVVWFNIENEQYKEGKIIGIDLGINKLIATSEGEKLGTDFKNLIEKILRKKKNSNAYKAALKERDNYIDKVVNSLDWNKINRLCYENLKGLAKNRKYKSIRVKHQHWIYRKVITRLIEKAQENRVRLVYVNPKNTSRTCPICNNIDEGNRSLELFCCTSCGYKQDADFIGATNILNKGLYYLRSLESLNSKIIQNVI